MRKYPEIPTNRNSKITNKVARFIMLISVVTYLIIVSFSKTLSSSYVALTLLSKIRDKRITSV